jgi:hypothetical protein
LTRPDPYIFIFYTGFSPVILKEKIFQISALCEIFRRQCFVFVKNTCTERKHYSPFLFLFFQCENYVGNFSGFAADQVVLVTGGGTGLGKGMSLKFSQLGAKVPTFLPVYLFTTN